MVYERFVAAALGGLATAGVIVLPYALVGALPNMWLAFGSFYARRDILSGYAANIWWIANYVLRAWNQIPRLGVAGAYLAPVRRIMAISTFQDAGFPNPRPFGTLLVLIASGWGLWRIRHARDLAVHALGAAFIVHAFFVLSVGVHEHHMMLAVPLLALAAALRPSLRRLFWAISLIVALNMNLFYGIGLGLGWTPPRGLLLVDLSVLLSLANIAALVWHGRVLVREASDDVASDRRRLECGAIPLREVRGGHVSRLQELEQHAIGIGRRPHHVVRQDELVEIRAVERLAWPDRGAGEPGRFRVRVCVVGGIRDRPAARPEPGAADFVRVCLARDAIGKVGNAARMRRRRTARKSRDGEIERPPEEVHRAALAEEARTKPLEHTVVLHEHAPEAVDRCAVVGAMHFIAIERNRIGNLVRLRVNPDVDVEPGERVHHAAIEHRDGLRLERHAGASSIADLDDAACGR